ncbi:hypothetical protein V502_10507, partial [Pseudogymnoascus sp. VKM F-4520 (FW-2644)]
MDPAVKNPDLKVQEPTLLPTICESQTEDAFKPTATASEVTEARTRKTTTREASIPETPSSTTTPQVPASKDQGQVQAQVEAGKESSVPRLFSLAGKVIVVTGGARGIGLSMSESPIECGATVHALDLLPIPSPDIADKHSGLHGLIAAAGIQHEAPALTYSAEICNRVLAVNITGVMSSAQLLARAMLAHGTPGSITLIASMSGTIANRGLPCAAYNASRAGVQQLGRSLAAEWGREGIR